MPSIPKISINISDTAAMSELRRTIENTINSLIDRINATKFTSNIDANNTRITNVAKPASPTDAVTLKYLNEALEGLSGAQRRTITTSNVTESTVTLSDQMTITKA